MARQVAQKDVGVLRPLFGGRLPVQYQDIHFPDRLLLWRFRLRGRTDNDPEQSRAKSSKCIGPQTLGSRTIQQQERKPKYRTQRTQVVKAPPAAARKGAGSMLVRPGRAYPFSAIILLSQETGLCFCEYATIHITPPKTPNSHRHVKETVETTGDGDKGRRGARQPGKANHMKGDKRRQGAQEPGNSPQNVGNP